MVKEEMAACRDDRAVRLLPDYDHHPRCAGPDRGESAGRKPVGVFTVCSTVPIALFMGIYMRFLRPGRVGEVSVIGIVAAGGLHLLRGVIAHDPYWGPALTFKDTTITFALIGYAFISALLPSG